MKANALFLLTLIAFGLAGCTAPQSSTGSIAPALVAATEITPDPTLDPKTEITFELFKATEAFKRGDFDQASIIYGEALAEEEARPKPRWRELALINYSLGQTFQKMRQHEKALHHWKASKSIYLRRVGPEHIVVANCHMVMAEEYKRRGDFAQEREHLFAALPVLLKELGPLSKQMFKVYGNLDASYHSSGDFKRAIEYSRYQNIVFTTLVGADGRANVGIYNSIALTLAKLEKHREAMEYFQKALTLARKNEAADHPVIGALHCSIVRHLLDQPRPDIVKANEALQLATAILDKPRVPEDARLICLFVKGRMWLAQKENKKALAAFEKVLPEVWRMGVGSRHPDTAHIQYFIARAHLGLGHTDEAKRFFHKAHAIQIRALLPTHPHLLQTKAALAEMGE